MGEEQEFGGVGISQSISDSTRTCEVYSALTLTEGGKGKKKGQTYTWGKVGVNRSVCALMELYLLFSQPRTLVSL